ncbi:hypothetical protein GRX66_16905, partial [Halobacterium sp. PCN9]|nr:hypothetical protein [Halobacterium bonnevillei]
MTATLGVLDRALYALFARNADSTRHDPDRKRYRASRLDVSFDVFLARVYGAAWLAFLVVGVLAAVTAGVALPATALGGLADVSPFSSTGHSPLSSSVCRPA